MKILITADSALDLPKEYANIHNIPLISVPVNLGEKLILDATSISNTELFDYVNKHKVLPKTSAINAQSYIDFFESYTKDYDAIIHFTLSSKVTVGYDNCLVASTHFDNVYVIDSASLSSGITTQVMHAVELREKSFSAKEIIKKLEKKKHNTHVSFVIEKLDYLHKGGRCSTLSLLGANLLKIRPSIKITDGAMAVHRKYRGKMDEVVRNYIIDTLNENPNYDERYCILVYSSNNKDMINSAKQTLQEHSKFEKIYQSITSSTISAHCGPNTLGLIFVNK